LFDDSLVLPADLTTVLRAWGGGEGREGGKEDDVQILGSSSSSSFKTQGQGKGFPHQQYLQQQRQQQRQQQEEKEAQEWWREGVRQGGVRPTSSFFPNTVAYMLVYKKMEAR
jgi:hypothetical protein